MTETPTLPPRGQQRPETAEIDAPAESIGGSRADAAEGAGPEEAAAPEQGGDPPPPTTPPHHDWKTPLYWIGGAVGVVVLAIVLFLCLFQWDWLRGPIARFASAKIHREVRIDGHLKVHLLTLTPIVRVEGLKVGQPDWGPRDRRMAEVESVTGAVKLLPLFALRVEVPLLDIEKPNLVLRADKDGRANWDFSDPNAKPGKPFKLPPIQQFVINDGHIDFKDDKRKITLVGTVNSNERVGSNAEGAFRLRGDGLINNAKFQLNVSGGPLINVHKDRPYPFEADLRAGATHINAKGQVTHPFDLGEVQAKLSLSGNDLNDVYHILGIPLPNTPPYSVAGDLKRNGKIWDFTNASGRVGASDIEGRVHVDTTNKRPYLDTTLNSRLLDWADLAAIFGAPGLSKAATPEQKAAVRTVSGGPARLLPDATLKIDQLRAMDADVRYHAAAIKARGLPLQNVTIVGNLNEGLLKLNPVTLGFPQGSLNASATLDARGATPVTSVDARLSNVRIEQFLPETSGQKPVEGTLQARAKLTGAGDSVHKAAAASNGQVTAVIPGGQIRQAFAELLGIDATKGLFLLLNKDQHQTDIRCAIADFRVVDGVLRAQRITVDTGVVVVDGQGSISLKDESMDLKFNGKPTHFRIVRLLSPITVGGHLAKPTFGVQAGPAIAQAGIAVGLTALAGPLAAILPFVDPGTAKNTDCQALLQQSQTTGAAPSTRQAPPVSEARVRAAKSR